MTGKIYLATEGGVILGEAQEVDACPPEFSDESLALRFAGHHANDLRYVDVWSKWLIWDGRRWGNDETRRAFDFARAECRSTAVECESNTNSTLPSRIASAKTVAATISLARADRRLAATVDQWDADPWFLNTPEGIVDLTTGESRPALPEDYMTKMTAVAPGGDCQRFLLFLDEVTGGDTTLVEFFQRMFGYCISGSTREHGLFFLYGTGANGKSVLLNTVSGILGDYHRTAPIETFTASNQDRHPTELACLQGRRLVTSIETEEGRRWAESRIKALTGGDKIAARFMRGDFFEYTPAFKLVIAGNHKPGLRTVDEAIRRRFHLVPFTFTIPEEQRDPELTTKLRQEWPGILAWMIDGALNWQEQGLRPPEAITAATRAYLEAEDALSAWLEECCDRGDPSAWETTSSLFGSWRSWAEKAGEHPGTMKRFVQNLEARGFTWERTRTGRGFRGVRLDSQEAFEPYWNC
jgi:putative DNA primase/helicase